MEICLAQNADVERVLTGVAVLVDRAFDMAFIIAQCTAFKLQGSSDGGSTYNDIAGSSTLLGAAGTLTAGVTYTLSLTRCRFDHVKPVFSGTNPVVSYVRQGIRQSPSANVVAGTQIKIIDPALGTA